MFLRKLRYGELTGQTVAAGSAGKWAHVGAVVRYERGSGNSKQNAAIPDKRQD
jgi:hypothetical protein